MPDIDESLNQKPSITPQEYLSILKGLHLLDISLLECRMKANPGLNDDSTLKASCKDTACFSLKDNKVLMDHEYNLVGKNGKTKILDVKAIYRVTFKSEDQITEEFFNIFKSKNLSIYTWPYFRELVSSMTSKSNLPHLILPMVIK